MQCQADLVSTLITPLYAIHEPPVIPIAACYNDIGMGVKSLRAQVIGLQVPNTIISTPFGTKTPHIYVQLDSRMGP